MRYLLQKINLFWWSTFHQKRFLRRLDEIQKDLIQSYESRRREISDETIRELRRRIPDA